MRVERPGAVKMTSPGWAKRMVDCSEHQATRETLRARRLDTLLFRVQIRPARVCLNVCGQTVRLHVLLRPLFWIREWLLFISYTRKTLDASTYNQ
jgi:hypothetical protein